MYMRKRFYCLKIGGSVITDKAVAYTARIDVIQKIAKTLVSLKSPMIISHGVGSFAHTSAKKYGGKNGYSDPWGIAKVARDAQAINQIVMDVFLDAGLPAVSFSPRSCLLTKKGELEKSFFDPIKEVLGQGLIPVIYGDVIWDTMQKTTIYSGETSLHLLIRYLLRNEFDISKIIQLSNVDGVLDEKNEVIPEITQKKWQDMKVHIKKMKVADVTGGMGHKVEEALTMTKYGIETVILNGMTDAFFNFVENNEMKGTVIL
jgi:isopentenyl phosphate kinase